MKEIPLTRGLVAIVDDPDFEWLNHWKWCASLSGTIYYALRDDHGRRVYMHREILGLPSGDNRLADHANGNGLDNRRANLRLATKSQNGANSRPRRNNSGLRGVFRKSVAAGWYAMIRVRHEHIYLGTFCDKNEAGRAYDRAAREHFGDFAQLNFPLEAPNA